MGLFGRKKKKDSKESKKKRIIEVKELNPEYKVVESYWIITPFAKLHIVKSPEYGNFQYFVDEMKLDERK